MFASGPRPHPRVPAIVHGHPPSWGSPAQPNFKACKLVTQCPLVSGGKSPWEVEKPGQKVQGSRCVFIGKCTCECMCAYVCMSACMCAHHVQEC